MAWARQSNACELYVYEDRQWGWTCHNCKLQSRGHYVAGHDAIRMFSHLEQHVMAGHKMPPIGTFLIYAAEEA